MILLHPPFYEHAKQQVLASLPMHKQELVSVCFEKLLADVERSLSVRNRDKFTEQLTLFKRDVSGWPKSIADSPSAPFDQMLT